jgi:flagellum-specific ATP synthase
MANRLRRLWTLYQENKDLIQVGAYEVGSNSELDMAIRLRPQIEALLQQSSDAAVTMRQSQQMLAELME